MRAIVLLLLVANLTLFLYTRLDSSGSGESARLKQQVQPDKIRLLSSQQVAALGPSKVAALADVCVEWGPFSDTERAKALADLEPLQLGRLLSQRRVDFDGAFWVSVGPFPNRPAADRRIAELRAQGVTDMSTVDAGRGQYAVSLGVFRTEQAATARADALSRLGVSAPRVEARSQSFAQTMLVVRDPQQPVVAKLKDLQAQYAGSDLKVGACPAAS
jgi:sporulation related protein